MNTFFIFLLIVTHALMLWLLIRHLKHRRHHTNVPSLCRDESLNEALHVITTRLANTPNQHSLEGWREAEDDEPEEECFRAVTAGQRVIGIAFILLFAALLVACCADELRW